MGPKGKSGTYYLGRDVNLGMLHGYEIFDGILKLATIVHHGSARTIIDAPQNIETVFSGTGMEGFVRLPPRLTGR